MSKKEKEIKTAKVAMESFFTKDIEEEGIKMPLFLPNGMPTKEWIKIRGVDTVLFRLKESQLKRKAIEINKIVDEEKAQEKQMQLNTQLIASLIVDWSFEKECNEQNIIKLLTNAPHIAKAINIAAANKALFMKERDNNS